ncbi:hypothetical protein PENTCL1PPCAC_25129, partial [Pristionchus entomophagus]
GATTVPDHPTDRVLEQLREIIYGSLLHPLLRLLLLLDFDYVACVVVNDILRVRICLGFLSGLLPVSIRILPCRSPPQIEQHRFP